MQAANSTNPSTGGPADQGWTTRRLLAWMAKAFTDKGLDSPRVLAELLMAHVARCDRIRLYMEADRPASQEERDELRSLVARALRHEPVQYLVGEAVFFTHTFRVDPRVLIPRPSTVTLLEALIEHTQRRGLHARNPYEDPPPPPTPTDTDTEPHNEPNSNPSDPSGPDDQDPAAPPPTPPAMTIADVCTGSGCVAISAALAMPTARVVATDLSADALAVAQDNAQRLAADGRITFAEGDLLEPLRALAPAGGFDAILSNPPYIPDHEWADVEPNVKDHEPELALRSGPDGLAHARPIIEGAMPLLTPGGLLAVEVAASTTDSVAEIAKQAGWHNVRIRTDIDGLPRTLEATRPL